QSSRKPPVGRRDRRTALSSPSASMDRAANRWIGHTRSIGRDPCRDRRVVGRDRGRGYPQAAQAVVRGPAHSQPGLPEQLRYQLAMTSGHPMKADLLILQICEFLDDGDGMYRLHQPSRYLSRLPGVIVVDCHFYHRFLPALVEKADVLVLPFI